MSYKKVLNKCSLDEFKEMYFRVPKMTYEDIACKLGLSMVEVRNAAGVCQKKHGWAKRNNKDTSKNKFLEYSDEELLELVKLYKSRDNAGSKITYAVRKRFGSWSKGTELALGVVNKGGKFDSKLPTTVYLIDFGDFIKIGITQQDLSERLRHFPEHKVLDYIETTLEDAKEWEYLASNKLNKYIFDQVPFELEKNGYTECYTKDVNISSLIDLQFI